MMSEFILQTDGGATTDVSANKMFCNVCFDVKEEDGEIEEGTDGVGSCFYFDENDAPFFDLEYFGRAEASGTDSFKFLEAKINNWD